jgi:hypothetical protein
MRAIPYVALLIGISVAALGAFGLAAPEELAGAINEVQKRITVYGIAGVRVRIGVILMLAAGTSRAPFLLGALGLIIVLGGLITPVHGRAAAAIGPALSRGRQPHGDAHLVRRGARGGLFIIWATKPRKK